MQSGKTSSGQLIAVAALAETNVLGLTCPGHALQAKPAENTSRASMCKTLRPHTFETSSGKASNARVHFGEQSLNLYQATLVFQQLSECDLEGINETASPIQWLVSAPLEQLLCDLHETVKWKGKGHR